MAAFKDTLGKDFLEKYDGKELMKVYAPGVAKLPGLATWQRAEAIINIAHPDFREELISAAEQQKIWRRSNKR